MNSLPWALVLTLGASLFGFTTAATIFAQDPAKGSSDAPVKKELDELREKSAKNSSPERLRIADSITSRSSTRIV